MEHSPVVDHLAVRRRRWLGWSSVYLAAALFLVAAADAEPQAENEPPAEKAPAVRAKQVGQLIRVPLPITGNVDTQVKQVVSRALAKMPESATRPVLIFEFVPSQNKFGEGSDYGRALALARYLSSRELSGVKTVAFVPETIKGHAVLAIMACEEIVMAPDAKIGEAGIDEPAEEPIDPTVRSGYRQIASRRRTVPAEVALGMLDREVEVLKVETEVSPEYVLRSELDELKKKHTIQSEKVLKRSGELALFTGREARELGIAKYLASDRMAVAKALGLNSAAVEDDPSLFADWRPIRLSIKGPITSKVTNRTQRMIQDKMRSEEVNFICLSIDSAGGSLADSMNLANFLAGLDSSRVRTVAYISNEARGDAAVVAVACDQIVMHREAVLGGVGEKELDGADIELAVQTIRQSIAPEKSISWSLPVALIHPDLKVYRYTHRAKGLVEYFSPEEVQQQADPDQWVQGEEITRANEPLSVTGQQAEQYGLASALVKDFAEFRDLYGIKGELLPSEPGWADVLIEGLASQEIAWILLLIGGAALYAELQAPGIGVGGFIAGLCFLLFFWSKYLDGTAGWLEMLLFLAGLVSILLEFFVLPGAGIFGLGGGLLILISLILASQTFVLPHNDYQWSQLRGTLLGLAATGAGVVVAALVMRRYLPHTPLFNNVMLAPPSGAELEDISHREALVDFESLIGHRGVTITQLAPSGKARFENRLVDVITDGEVISRGAEVVVVAVQGNRVVVRSAAGIQTV